MFKPTYLYIKRHSVTGLKYFGKTTRTDILEYKGSGKYWLRHINAHGKEFVETLWYELFTDKTSLEEYANQFSKENRIVESTEWANLIPETGLDGGSSTKSNETKLKMRLAKLGKKRNHFSRSSPTEETRKKLSEAKIGNQHAKKSSDSVTNSYSP